MNAREAKHADAEALENAGCRYWIANENRMMYAAEDDGKLVVLISSNEVEEPPIYARKRCARTDGLYAKEEYRRRGIGLRLIERVEKWAKRRNCDYLGVSAHKNNKAAWNLYEDEFRLEYRNYRRELNRDSSHDHRSILPMNLPNYDEIDPRYRFDLTQVFETPADWEKNLSRLGDETDELDERATESLSTAADLRTLLEAVEDCYRRKQRLELYAKLGENVQQGEDAAMDRLRQYRSAESRLEAGMSAVRRRLGRMDEGKLDRLIADLDEYQRYADNIREQARHVRSPEMEEAMDAFDDVRRVPGRLVSAVWRDFDPPTVERPDGESVEIRRGNLRAELSHENRDYRRRVYEAYWTELNQFEHTLTMTYSGKLSTANAEAAARDYDSIRDRAFRKQCYPESGLHAALPGAVHDTMIETIRENLEPYHRAQELRRKRLDIDDLRPWDLEVSIADDDPADFDYETARSHILTALEPLGDDYVDRARSLFEERRIDVFPSKDKWEIPAYGPSSAVDGPFILANFRNDVRTTFFICHELGHAMHVEHHREGPTRYATCPRPVEEIPSTLHELLLVDHLKSEGGILAAAARNQLLESIGRTFYVSTMRSIFVHRLAEHVEQGKTVTPAFAKDVWADLQSTFRAPVEFDDAGRTWFPRVDRDIYSNYQYVLGATGALVVHEKLREGDLTIHEYRDFLRSTGRKPSVTLFERLGCDVRTEDPYKRASETFASHVNDADCSS